MATRCSGVVILKTTVASMALALLHALVSSALSGSCLSLMTWRIPLAGVHHTTLVSAYAPTLDSDEATKDAFYNRLDEILRRIPNNDKILLMGDFNARVGSNHLAWEGVLGRNGVGSCNANGHRLLTLCAEHQLTITNTRFQLEEIYKTTWMHPRSKMWHQLDHIMVKQRDFSDVKLTRVMRGACGDTDHRLVGSQLTMKLRSRPRGRATNPRLNTACLKDHSKVDALQSELRDSLQTRAADCASTEELTAEWDLLSRLLLIGARTVLGVKQKRNRDWFDENDSEIKRLLE